MDPETLFVPEEFLVPSVPYVRRMSSAAMGSIAEQWAVATLIERGLPVARPIVDDDGVDLIVNYRTTVQVKCSDSLERGRDILKFTLANCTGRAEGRGRAPHHGYRNVDYFALCWFSMRRWWIVPRDVVLSGKHINLALDGKYRAYENAWDLLGGDLHGQEVR